MKKTPLQKFASEFDVEAYRLYRKALYDAAKFDPGHGRDHWGEVRGLLQKIREIVIPLTTNAPVEDVRPAPKTAVRNG